MMRILSFSIKDFLSHKDTSIDCKGISTALILGKVAGNFNVSNGVGKTNIAYGLRYGLTGELPPDMVMENLVREGQVQAEVEVTFSLNDSIFRVIRTRNNKTNKSEITLEELRGSWTSIGGKTNGETEGIYRDLTKLDSKLFDNSIYLPQKSFSNLITTTPAKRKELFKDLLQISIYSKYEKIAKEKLATLQKQIDTNKTLMESLRHPDHAVQNIEANVAIVSNDLQQYSHSIESLEKETKDLTGKAQVFRSALAEMDSTRKNKISIEEKIRKAQYNREVTGREGKSFSLKKEEAVSAILSLGDDVKGIEDEIEKISSTISPHYDELEKQKTNQANGRAWIAKTELSIKDLRKPITDKDVCDDCFQSVPHQHRASMREKRLLALKEEEGLLVSYRAKLVKVDGKILQLEAEVIAFNKFQHLSATLSNKKETLYNKKKGLEDSIISLNSSLQDVEKKKKAMDETIAELTAINQTLIIDDILLAKNLKSIEAEVSVKEENILDVKELLKCATIKLGGLEQQKLTLLEDEEKVKVLKATTSSLEKEMKVRVRECEAWNHRGIPTMIINNVLDDLQVEANRVLSAIRPEMEITFQISKIKDDRVDDTLKINYRLHGCDRVVAQLSGGQKISASLALMLGYKALAKKNLGIDVKLLILDEMDADLDPVSIDEYAGIIKTLQEEMMILIITHNDRLKSKFSTAIVVEDDGRGGVSTVETI